MISRLKLLFGAALAACASIALAQQQPVMTVGITKVIVTSENDDKIVAYTVTNPGAGYTSTPTVVISGGGGTNAAASAILADVVASIAVTSGGGNYTSAPTVTITGGSGTGATASATVVGGQVTAVTLDSNGSGYTGTPTVTFSGGGGSGAAAVATVTRQVVQIVPTNVGSGYTSTPTVTLTGGGPPTTQATAVALRGVVFNPPNEAYGPAGSLIGVSALAVGTHLVGSFTYSFYVNGISIGKTNGPVPPPTEATVPWTPPQPGSYFITVVADDGANTATSLAIRYFATGTIVNSPMTKSIVPVGSSVVLKADATVQQGFIKQIQFYDNGVAIGAPDSTIPYSLIYTPGAGTHNITAQAMDNDGNLVPISSPVELNGKTPVGLLPTCVISSPANDSAIAVPSGGTIPAIPVNVTAQSSAGLISKVELYVDGVLFGTKTTYPYTFSWQPTVMGKYHLVALAYDDKQNVVASTSDAGPTSTPSGTTVSITVQGSGGSSTGPAVAITYPSTNSSVPVGFPTVISTAVTPGTYAIKNVTFSIDGLPDQVVSSYPYSYSWTPTNLGNYTVTATVLDTQGNSNSAKVSVVVGAAGGTTVLTSTATNALVPQGSSVLLSADVNLGQGAIKQIQFFDNGVAVGAADTTAPYSIVFAPSGGAGSVHVLTAQATDNNNATLTASAPLTLTVSNAVTPLPTVGINTPANDAKIAIPTRGNSIPVKVDARSTSGFITKVELYVDGVLLGTKNTFPYDFTWAPSVAGVNRLIALGYDDKNNSIASSVNTVTIAAPPSVSITSPANNATVTGSAITQVTVTATSANGYPVNVQLFADGKYVGETSITSGSVSGTILYTAVQKTVVDGAGNITVVPTPLYAIASDSLGFATTSEINNVNVTNGGSSTGSTVIGLRPTVTVTSPLAGTSFPVSAPVSLSANAADADGNIVQVIFSANGQIISTLTAYPYYTTWKPLNLGVYAITAKVTDNDGNTVTSAPVNVSVTDSGPGGTSVAITSPITGAVFTAGTETTLRATAVDDVSIASVQFYINSQPFGDKVVAAPYNLKWLPVTAGNYTIFARATDNVGNQATSASVVVAVNANASPAVALTSPVAGTTITAGAAVALAATASDSDGTVASVKFLANTVVVGSATSAPYTASWIPSGAGNYTLVAQATDDSGNISSSLPVQVSVLGNQPPTVSLSAPKTGATVSAGTSVTVTATAADIDGSVSKVQFFANGSLVGQSSSSPYQVAWTPGAQGVFRLTAVATDNAGATVTSDPVVVAAVTGAFAVDTVATGLTINFNTSDSGNFSLINLHGQTVTFIGYVPAAQTTTQAKVYYFANVPLDSAGNFLLTDAANAAIFSGQMTASGVSGTFADGANSIMFAGNNTTAKTGAAPSGYYSGSISDHPGSALTGFVGLDGILTLYVKDGALVDAGAAAVSANGSFTITTRSGNKITGTANPVTGLLTGEITKSDGSRQGDFTGAQASGATFSDGSLRNISSRGFVGTGDNVLIAGFVVSGSAPKQVLIRAVGPTLTTMGVSGALANPTLYLFNRTGSQIASNDNWGTGGAGIAAAASKVGAFNLSSSSLDASILMTLSPGVYSTQVTGAGNTTGIALVELYDVDSVPAFAGEKMVNISTRGFVGTGDNVLIAGFVVNGSSPKKILVRGVGPSLATVGLPNGILTDPLLRIVKAGGPLVRENDNWAVGNDAGLVAEAAAKIGAFPLVAGSKDAAILMNLPPGVYSAQLSGSGTSTGIGMIEVYEVQ